MASISDDLIVLLKKIGFTNYESKAYLGLLQKNPATGYEVSQVTDVPRSVIYSTLRKLESNGVVISVHGKPVRYIPLSPKQLLSRLESDFSKRLNSLSEELLAFEDKPDSEGFWNIRGYKSLMEICDTHIRDAKKQIIISGWSREIDTFHDSLLEAQERGVEVVVFSFNEISQEYGDDVYAYNIPEERLKKIWDHKLILVTDSRELIMGPANKNEDEQAIWTQNEAVLKIAINYVVLDITLFGQRMGVDTSGTVLKIMPERVDDLDKMIEQYNGKENVNEI
ncbi:MAG: TrmB family transcriptional regulator [Fidelibacterota bacterium]